MPELLFNHDRGEWEYVADDQLTGAVGSGRFSPPKDTTLFLRSPDGERFEATGQEAFEAIQKGYTIETQRERRQAYSDREFGGVGGGLLSLVGGGVTQGLLSGFANPLIERAAPGFMDNLRLAREQHPGLFTTGEIAGLLAPQLALSKAAKAAKGTTVAADAVNAQKALKAAEGVKKSGMVENILGLTPAGIIARGARGARNTTAQMLQKSPDSLLPRVVEGVVDAVPVSAGLTIGNAVLDDVELDAELIKANASDAALWGAGIPFAIHAARAGANRLKPHLASVAKKVAGDTDLPPQVEESKWVSAVLRFLSKPIAVASDKPQKFVDEMVGFGARQKLVEPAEQLIEDHVGAKLGAMNSVSSALDDLSEAYGKNNKFKILSKHFEGVDGRKAGADTMVVLKTAEKQIQDYLGISRKLNAPAGLPAEMRSLANLLRAGRNKIADEADRLNAGVITSAEFAAFSARQLDEVKKTLQSTVSRAKSNVRARGAVYDQDALDILTKDKVSGILSREWVGIEPMLRKVLEDDRMFGRTFAAAQRGINAAYNKVLGGADVLRGMQMKVGESDFAPVLRGDDQQIRSFIKESYHDVNVRYDLMNKYYENVEELAGEFVKHVEDPKVAAAAKRAMEASRKARKTLGEARTDITALHAAGELNKGMGGVVAGSMMLGGMLGGQVGGAFGIAGGGAAGALVGGVLARPIRLLRVAAGYERAKARFKQGVRQGAADMVNGVSRVGDLAVRLDRPLRMSAVSFTNERPQKGETRAASYSRIMKELATPMAQTMEPFQRSLQDIHDLSPAAASGVSALSMRGKSFLQGKARSMFGAQAAGILQREIAPPESQLRSWERYVLAVDDPLGTVQRLFAGHASSEEVEALRAVYPRIYQDVATEVQMALATRGEPPTRSVQLQLSTFFGTALDPTSGAEFARKMWVRDMQTAGQPQPTNPAGAQGTVNRGQSQRVLDIHQTRGQRNEVA